MTREEATKDIAVTLFGSAPTIEPIIRCRECKWFGKIGCAISIVDDSDKPTETDYCSFAERKDEVEE